MPDWNPRNTKRARELRRAATPAERKLWPYLARSALGAKFSRQMPVGPWYVDFLCRELKLAIELDGASATMSSPSATSTATRTCGRAATPCCISPMRR
ncbi:DUF559 domain-containing protein [Erythrobacter sp. LQ02-29]|uniref:endonuclease domain-containing protein n=1 Tax=Erythrobacter sp. LQ02-29 TaxID=2920384 RepID=UPI0021069245|nr:DUF559 domain-containing protein [Erythrobacter sp. LQ02-29]MCP9221592.1 DUF559 domain-containing protein [Erythrobacter sp. LQ02-29]